MSEAKILVIDIETSPHLGYVWGLWDQNIALSQVADVSTILCFAAKWFGDKKIQFHSWANQSHDEMIQAAWNLLDEADVVVGFNQKSFDVKHLNREFLLAGLGSPSPYANLDLLTIARSKFKFASNKLEHVAHQLGVGQKMKNSGFDLWLGCMAGTVIPDLPINRSAWKEMEKYNRQDVNITEQVYLKLRSWDTSNVHLGAFSGSPDACRVCNGINLQKRGFKARGAQVYQQYLCNNCGAWSRGATAIKTDGKPNTRSV